MPAKEPFAGDECYRRFFANCGHNPDRKCPLFIDLRLLPNITSCVR
jgi:hypothetical protein